MMGDGERMDPERTCAANSRRLGLWARLRLFAGRPRRLFENWFRGKRVEESLARRRGECHRCGACCQMGNRCRFLVYEDGLASCKVYDKRQSVNCRRFPMDKRDLADRDVILPEKPCGYNFDEDVDTCDRD